MIIDIFLLFRDGPIDVGWQERGGWSPLSILKTFLEGLVIMMILMIMAIMRFIFHKSKQLMLILIAWSFDDYVNLIVEIQDKNTFGLNHRKNCLTNSD